MRKAFILLTICSFVVIFILYFSFCLTKNRTCKTNEPDPVISLRISDPEIHNTSTILQRNEMASSTSQSTFITNHNQTTTIKTVSMATLEVHFLYLLQTESCLPSNLRTNEALGNGSLDFHVIVLSFKQLCDNRSLPHVEYILDTSTTWTTGRNLLFETAMKRNTTYLYYIFMDDDVMVVDNNNAEAWRRFEGFLQSVEPAVVGLDLPGQNFAERIHQIHKDRSCFREDLEYVYMAGLWYDAMVNAFHHKAVKYLLPYDATFDQKTWWASQMALIVRSEILFRGQVVLHGEIRSVGSQNRPYPRDLNFTPDMYTQFTKGLDARIVPGCIPQCAKIMINQWIAFGNNHGWDSSTLCLPPPPPHDPVEPCRYQCNLL